MYIKKGTKRIVLVFDNFDFVVKVAKIRLLEAIRCAIDLSSCGLFWRSAFSCTVENYGIAQFLFAGIVENWNERKFCKETRLKCLAPTNLSIFGLVNIQKKCDILCNISNEKFWKKMHKIISDKIWDYPHLFSSIRPHIFRQSVKGCFFIFYHIYVLYHIWSGIERLVNKYP